MNILKASLFAFLVSVSPVCAQAMMDVAPTTIQLAPGQSGLFYLTNHSDKPINVQVEALDWQQQDGADKLTPSQTLFASPPVTEIAPGGRQTVRVMASPGAAPESQYRLLVSELPDAASTEAASVRVLLQFSVPVFVGPLPKAAPALAWDATQTADGVDLAVRNDSDFAAKCVQVALTSGGKPVAFDPGAVFYVLPHASRRFHLAGYTGGAVLHVAAHDLRSDRDIAADFSLRR
jgi:fimbrial chaperone protein